MGRGCWPVSVEPVVFLTFFAITLVDVITQKYIYTTLKHKADTGEESFCENLNCYNCSDISVECRIQCSSLTDYWLLYINLASLLLAIPSTIILGTWSETEGRKIVLVASLLGVALHVALVFIILHFHEPLYFLVIASLITSVLGFSTSLMSSCMAYIADITSRGQRTFRILFLDSAAGVGVGLAYFVSGFYMEYDWFYHFLWLGIAVCIINIIYILFYMEESILLPGFYGSSTIFSFRDCLEIFRVFTYDPGNGRRWRLLTFVTSLVVVGIIIAGTNSLLILHAQTSLCFSLVLTGFLAGALCLRYLSSLVSVKLFQSILKASNNWIIEAGLVSFFAGLILASFSTSTHLTFDVPALQFLGVLPPSVMKATLSKLVEPQEQGILFAVLACLESASSVFGVFLFRRIYVIMPLSRMTFVIGALLLIVPVVLVGIVEKNESPTTDILLFSNERSSESDFGRQCTISSRANTFPVLDSADLSGYDYIPSAM